ncbi:hypothetical protein SCP_0700110 [Sparassis crispa]|uniref:F-box domain-containing protein n=1 Tax=Sparassis crispa TaxID=139825 RepID=A0A401GRF8_9APHY|nr:hypothetical protein SCP_0700110 [Sparassis crispa]GBE84831.1 hypothetical protein SCP_0700110 [Sparassis crispa]
MNYLYLGCDIRPSLLIQHIVHFTRLKHLFLEGPISSSQLLSCCGGLVDLAFLSVSGLREPSQDDVSSIGFPSLRELKMTSDPSIPGVIHLLASVSSPHLQEVALLGLSWDDLDEWRSCFCVLCSKFSSSLRKIDVTSFAPVNASSVSFMHIVQPLLGISGIQSFTIWCDGSPFMLTDYDIHDIASSWQNLEDLYLRVGEGSPRERPSVYAIDAFAQFCPRLRQLTISCLDIFLPPPWPLSLTMFPRLTELNCGKGDRGLRETTDAAMRLAHFLHDRCPCLDLHTLARNSPDLFLALRDLRSREGNQSDDDSVEAL